MPYRIDLADPPADALDRLVALGALDVEQTPGGLAALLPDGVSADSLAGSLGVRTVPVSPAVGRDDGSVWILSPRPVRAGTLLLVPVDDRPVPPDALRLHDSVAFGTGLHPTTALCLAALEESIGVVRPARALDVGTGSGVLALAALLWGVPLAVGLDIDADALRVARENARVNDRARQLHLVRGGPDAVRGQWPLVIANILPAPLIEMAPALVRRLGHGARLVLSGVPASVQSDVEQAYRRLGLRTVRSETRAGWSLLVLAASW